MNKDITIMIELQRYWDVVLSQKTEIERAKKNILQWQTENSEKQTKVKQALDYNKALTLKIKENETALDSLDSKIKKLEEKRLLLKSEKELKSLENEVQTSRDEKSTLEDELLELIDKQEDIETKTNKLQQTASEFDEQVQKDIQYINDKIKSYEAEIAKYEEKFDSLFESLSQMHKSKFKKLISAKEGKGIAELEGVFCGCCRFSIPEYLVRDVEDRNSIVNCSHCGRFIYKGNF
jgi:predicted  nucleic acid-binding Zn-ribbon protein